MAIALNKEDWIFVAKVTEFINGMRKIIELDDGTRVLVTNIDGEFFAVESMCTHAMFDLDDAVIEDHQITCPLHGAHFCMRTGAVLSPPAFEALATFAVRTENGEVQVRDQRWD